MSLETQFCLIFYFFSIFKFLFCVFGRGGYRILQLTVILNNSKTAYFTHTKCIVSLDRNRVGLSIGTIFIDL